MKRVFEGKFFTKSSKTTGGMVKTMRLYKTCVDFIDCLPPNKPFRITVEDLPDSKPEPKDPCETCPIPGGRNCSAESCKDYPKQEPEKNCGNCGNMRPDCTTHERRACENWQPKAAEPQSWEQRLCEVCRKDLITPCRATADDRNNCDRICLIRAEIERVREEEKQLVFEWLRIYHSFDSAYAIKENKHREKP